MRRKKYMYIFLFSVCYVSSLFGMIWERQYLNECPAPVEISVPYYPKGVKRPKQLNIVLQPGDLYQSREGRNGVIYEEYGLMPKIAESLMSEKDENLPFLYNSFKKSKEEKNKKYKLAISGTNIPSWWINHEIERKEKWKYYTNFEKRQDLEQIKNLDNKTLKTLLSDPSNDVDGDGINNFNEMKFGTSPFIKNSVVAYPSIVEIDPAGCLMVTGIFYIENFRSTNIVCSFDFDLGGIDKKYKPRLSCSTKFLYRAGEYGSTNTYIFVPAKGKTTIQCILNSQFLPYEMTSFYDIYIECKGDLIDFNKIEFYINGDYGPVLEKPGRLRPIAGQRLENFAYEKFLWDGRDTIRVSEWLFYPEFYNVKEKTEAEAVSKSSKMTDIGKRGNDRYIKSADTNDFIPGNYIWRVIKQTYYSKPVASDWSWFSIGKEIAPPVEKKTTFKPYHRVNASDTSNENFHCYELMIGVPCEFTICNTNQSLKAPFEKPLPKGLKVILSDQDRWWTLVGTPKEVGRFTNAWYINNNYKKSAVFSIYDDDSKNVSKSIYNVDEGAVIHNLTIDVPFTYFAKTYYDYFTKQGGPEISEKAKVAYNKALPDGLELEYKNGNLKISGTPTKAGTYSRILSVSEGGKTREEKHIFNVAAINGPKRTVWSRKAGNFNMITDKGKVTLITFPNENIWYNIGRDIRCLVLHPTPYIKLPRETQLLVESIDPLPEGLEIEKDGEYHYISGKIAQPGCYTNHIRIVNGGFTYTNTHIYKIVKPRF